MTYVLSIGSPHVKLSAPPPSLTPPAGGESRSGRRAVQDRPLGDHMVTAGDLVVRFSTMSTAGGTGQSRACSWAAGSSWRQPRRIGPPIFFSATARWVSFQSPDDGALVLPISAAVRPDLKAATGVGRLAARASGVASLRAAATGLATRS